jgi:hypothetical protein
LDRDTVLSGQLPKLWRNLLQAAQCNGLEDHMVNVTTMKIYKSHSWISYQLLPNNIGSHDSTPSPSDLSFLSLRCQMLEAGWALSLTVKRAVLCAEHSLPHSAEVISQLSKYHSMCFHGGYRDSCTLFLPIDFCCLWGYKIRTPAFETCSLQGMFLICSVC